MKIFARVQGVFFVGMLIFSPLAYAQNTKSVSRLAYHVSEKSEVSVLSQHVDYENLEEHGQGHKEQVSYSPAWGLLGFGVFFLSLYFVMRREEFELAS